MSRFVSFYISSAIFLFYALSINVPSGYAYGALLLLISVFFLAYIKKNESSIPLRTLYFPIFLLMGYFSILLFDILYHDLPLEFLDNPSRLVFASLVAIVLARSPPSLSAFWAGIIVGAISAGLLAMYQKYQLNIDRPNGFDHPIQFGNISILLGFLNLSGMTWAKKQNHSWVWITLLALGFILGTLGSVLSQSRGGWLALPIVIIILLYSQSSHLTAKRFSLISMFIGVLLAAIYYTPQTGVALRVTQAFTEIQNYDELGDNRSSLGNRIALWKTSLDLTKEKWILGYGEIGYLDALKIRVNNKQAPSHLLNYNHVHNDYLDALVKRGVVGLIALLLLYGLPLVFLIKYLKHTSVHIQSIAQSGVILISSYIVFGLSQGFLVHHSGVIFLAFSMVIIFSLLQKELQNNV